MRPINSVARPNKITLAGISTTQIVLFFCFSFTLIENPIRQANYRRVLLFAPSANNQELLKQQAIFQADTAGNKERDLEIVQVIYSPDQVSTFKKYKVAAAEFTFILIGKDGGEKLRRKSHVSLNELYQLIDSMPMRKIEMKKGKG